MVIFGYSLGSSFLTGYKNAIPGIQLHETNKLRLFSICDGAHSFTCIICTVESS